ncbi:MAG: DUF4178 domain-containing protein [Gammaproteobacteria bacterium]|nr:DUF4178 domain-containing protein [Gammaproteobacteria bacterium]
MEASFPAYNCPSCGGPIELHLRYAKMITCPSCGNALLLEDKAVLLAGVESVMADYPSLLQLYGSFKYRDWEFMPVGHLRFEYAQGYWDEWWAASGAEGKWISVDEGDFAIEEPVELDSAPLLFDLAPGRQTSLAGETLYVTERGHAKCIGLEGELPELHSVGEEYEYVHLSGKKGRLYTLELKKNGVQKYYRGHWADPFEFKLLSP